MVDATKALYSMVARYACAWTDNLGEDYGILGTEFQGKHAAFIIGAVTLKMKAVRYNET
jgi:hypothetical protein